MTTRKMRVNAAKQAKRDADNNGTARSRSRIHHSSCRCPNCGGTQVGTLTLTDIDTGEVVEQSSLCITPDKKELH